MEPTQEEKGSIPFESEEDPPEAIESTRLARLRRRREEIRRGDRVEYIDIPGYNGDLVGVYSVVDWEWLKDLAQKTVKKRDPRKELFAHISTLIASCVEIRTPNPDALHKDERGLAPLGSLIDDSSDEQVSFKHTERLAEIMGFPQPDSSRDGLRQLFPNDLSITSHHQDVAAWMEGSVEESDTEFLGESEGGAK